MGEEMPDLATIVALRRLATVTQDVLPDMTMRAFVLLCLVAEDENQTVSAYAQAAGFPLQTTSRILQDLSGRARPERVSPRPALLERIPSPLNLREVTYRLAPAGKHLLLRMSQALPSPKELGRLEA